MPNYNVKITGYTTVLVINAKDEDEAMTLACDQTSSGDLEIECDEASLVPDTHLDHARRHADNIVEDEE